MRTRSLGIVLGLAMAGTAVLGGSGNFVSAGPAPLLCFDQTVTIVASGTVVNGTSRSDVIYVPSGKSVTVHGNGGNDFICSDNGAAKIYGGAGNDKIDGIGFLYGDAGNDTITSDGLIAQEYRIEAYGGAGDDIIDVQDADFVDGGSGDDHIHADDSDEVRGGSGNDDMNVHDSGAGFGDAGDDWIEVRDTKSLDCGAGRDHFAVNGDEPDQIRRCETEFEVDPI